MLRLKANISDQTEFKWLFMVLSHSPLANFTLVLNGPKLKWGGRTLSWGGWCLPAGWGCPAHPTQRWRCCRSCPPPCTSAPRARPLSSSPDLRKVYRQILTITKLLKHTINVNITLWPILQNKRHLTETFVAMVFINASRNYLAELLLINCMRAQRWIHLPISKTIKTILRFFDPAFTSLIKITASLEIFDISERRGEC